MENQQTTINISKSALKKFGILAVENEVSRKKIIESLIEVAAGDEKILKQAIEKIKKPR